MDQRTSFEDTHSTTGPGKTTWVKRGLLVLTSVLVLGMAVGIGLRAVSAAPSPWASLPQSVAPQVAGATATGSVAGTQRMTLGITLQSRNEANLKAYAADVAKPHSKVFHQYLTPAQFALNFGANPAALNAVEKYFQSQGLHLDNATSGGLFLQFTGTVAQVESALHTHINTYRSANGRTFFANATALQVPSALAPFIVDVAGTENARVSHPSSALGKAANGSTVTAHVTVTCPTNPTLGAAGGGTFYGAGLLPTQINNAYGFLNSSNPGSGRWAAFVEYDGFLPADLAQYETCMGQSSNATAITSSASSSTPFIITQNVSNGLGTVLSQTGQNYGTPLSTGSNATQVEEDLEILLGLVPNVSHITVMESANNTLGTLTALSALANENAAETIGYSWGMCEADVGFPNAAAEEQIFMQMALQGQTVLASTGDNSLYACNGDGNVFRQYGYAVQDPASDPFVTAVGGTTLAFTTNAGAAWAAEQPWINSANVVPAAGGGISQFWGAMPWQATYAAYAANPNAGGAAQVGVLATQNGATTPSRVVPDVSAVADPTNDGIAIYCTVGSCMSGATTFTNAGGTTAATDIWMAAAVEALQTSSATLPNVGGRLGLITPALYTAYNNDLANGGTAANQVTQPGGIGTKYCDYAHVAKAALGATNADFSVVCSGTAATDYILNDSLVINGGAGVTVQTPSLEATKLFLNPPAAANGFSVVTSATGTIVQGYNALTGLGSPNVGNTSTATGVNLAAYLAAQARYAQPRVYMVAQGLSDNKYWIGAYETNPYVQNMPVNTAWYPLNTVVFSGSPVVVDDGGANPKNLYIIGPAAPTSTGLAMYKWNIASATGSQVTLVGGNLPGAVAGSITSCSSISAATNGTSAVAATTIGVYCVTPGGALYSTAITIGTGAVANWSNSPLLNSMAYAPQVASDDSAGTGNYLVLAQTTNGAGVYYQYFANVVGGGTFTGAGAGTLFPTGTGTSSFSFGPPLATTCLTTPSVAYVKQTDLFAAACTASDTKQMWANVFYPKSGKFNPLWSLLGQPSPSVTFMPGNAVAVDNYSNDASYGQVFYIAEGSDKAMYVDPVTYSTTTFLGKISGWQSVSLPGIFNSNSAADFVNA